MLSPFHYAQYITSMGLKYKIMNLVLMQPQKDSSFVGPFQSVFELSGVLTEGSPLVVVGRRREESERQARL
jgi:hypothetical protein